MELTFALGDYAHTRTLISGATLQIDGHAVNLRRVTDTPAGIFSRAREEPPPFDVTEMSLATTYVLTDRRDARFLALPVFPSRMFRHAAFYVRDTNLRPEQLRGKRLGVVRYGMTAAVWARALLAESYGIAPADVTWWIGEEQFFQPAGITLNPAGGKAALEAMLLAGDLDCLLSVDEPPAFRKGQLHRLFPEFGAEERAQFQRTGLYPIMHCVLVRRTLTESEPWLPGFLQKAFEAAKAEALHWLLDMDASSLPLPFQHTWANEVRELLGT
ncbi:MAG: ABC transporter substrate-binding protein, partial [SAR324 cluster bacterium]|nr:ABC transporter substrate-binding protein [SAR324 cluster bacterium]